MFNPFKKKKEDKIDVDSLLKETEKQYPQPKYEEPEPTTPSYQQPAFTMHERTRQKLEDMGFQEQQQYQPTAQQPVNAKEELINAKLDTIKAMLDSLTHRLNRIEQELKKRW